MRREDDLFVVPEGWTDKPVTEDDNPRGTVEGLLTFSSCHSFD